MKKPGLTLQAATAALEGALAEVARRFVDENRIPCRANCQQWPLLTVSFRGGAHRLRFVQALDCQPGFSRLPSYHLTRLAGPEDEADLLRRFLSSLLRHEGWRRALSALAEPPAQDCATTVERIVLLKRCNQRCLFCGEKDDGVDLSWSESEDMLRDIRRRHPKNMGSVLLVITGGEPTLSPHLPRLIRRARALGIGPERVILTTNGVRLADPAYAAALQEAGLTRVEFAFHSHLAKVYGTITGTRGHFAKAAAGLRESLRRFEVTINTVINRHNYARMPAFVRYLHRLRDETGGRLRLMPSIVVMEMDTAQGTDWKTISVPCARLGPFLEEAVRWDHAQPRRIIIERFDGRCYAPICVGRGCPEFLEHAPIVPVREAIPYLRDGRKAQGPSGSRVKSLRCRACRYDPFCLGVTPPYAARYGLSELVPVP